MATKGKEELLATGIGRCVSVVMGTCLIFLLMVLLSSSSFNTLVCNQSDLYLKYSEAGRL
jgi:hypothetical protein